MPTAKDEVRRLLEALPDDATLEDVQYSIYVRERIERARREVGEGKLIEHGEVEDRMRRWLDDLQRDRYERSQCAEESFPRSLTVRSAK
jgi:hypothetical protein